MPILDFAGGTIAATSAAAISAIRFLKNFGQGGAIEALSLATIIRTARTRSIRGGRTLTSGSIGGTLKGWLNFGQGTIAGIAQTAIKYFLNAKAIAPPVGHLYRASIESLINPLAPSPAFNTSRLVRGDLVPIGFFVQGQRLQGLRATFEARQRGVEAPLTISKVAPGSIKQTQPVLDREFNIDSMSGNLAIEPADTATFPEVEVEMLYHFYFTDGIGRTYTVERGSFVVYPAL